VLLVEEEKVSIDVHVKINLTLILVMFSFSLLRFLNKYSFSLQVLTTERFLLQDVVDPHLATCLDSLHGLLLLRSSWCAGVNG